MRNLFNYDNPLMSGLAKFFRLVMLDARWVIFCIPVVTAGASTAAFYYTIQKNLKQDRGYTAQCVWDGFRANLRSATRAWLLFLAAGLVLFLDLGVLAYLSSAGHGSAWLDIVLYVLLAVLLSYAIWTLACIARFENTLRATLKNAAILAAANPGRSLLILLLVVFCAFAVWVLPMALLVLPGACLWLASVLIEPVFRANMTDAQRRQEDAWNTRSRGD